MVISWLHCVCGCVHVGYVKTKVVKIAIFIVKSYDFITPPCATLVKQSKNAIQVKLCKIRNLRGKIVKISILRRFLRVFKLTKYPTHFN